MVACELGETEVVQELLAQTLIDVNAVDNVSAVFLLTIEGVVVCHFTFINIK